MDRGRDHARGHGERGLIFLMNALLKKSLAQGGPFIGLILVIVLFSIPAETREFFLTYNNFKIIFTQKTFLKNDCFYYTFQVKSVCECV